MKKKRIGPFVFSLQIILCLALNWGGDRLISNLNWPMWLDTFGTVLCAYQLGPFCGAAVGATSNLLMHMLYGVSPAYALISILTGVIVGVCARKGKMNTFLGTLTTSLILASCVTAGAYPINLLMNGGSTGNIWGDAVMGFLGEHGIPRWGGLFIGGLYVEFLDKLIILVALFAIVRISRMIRSWIGKLKKNADEGHSPRVRRNQLLKTAVKSIMLAAFFFQMISIPVSNAEGTDQISEYDFNNYVQTIYSTSNGLPCGEANDIAMTGDGIMWIGTYAGLYRYNGREFRWMDKFDSVRNVNCLYVDEEGRLWIGTNDNGLSIMIREQVVNVIDESLGLPSNSVKSIIQSSDGYYYIGTSGSMQTLTLSNGLSRVSTISEIDYADHSAADENGNVAAVTNDGTLFLLRQGQILSSRKLSGSQTVFRSCEFDEDGILLAATTGNEIYRFKISAGEFDFLDRIECPGLQNIKNIYFVHNGIMIICADNGIAVRDRNGDYEQINTNDFNNSIDNMLVDYQGNLWFTSSRLGLLRMARSDFRDIYSTAGMNNRVVNTIVQWKNAYYIGTDKGLDAFDLKGKTQIRDDLTEKFSGIRIRCMIVDDHNHLWICTYGSGLVEITPDGEEYLYNQENGAFGNRARVVQQLRDGTVLAAGDTGLSYIQDHNVIETIDRSSGNISTMVLSIVELDDGRILVGTDGNGIVVLENRKPVRKLTRASGLSSDVILRIVRDPKTGGAFVVTSNGLCYMNTDESVRTLDNFPYYNNYDVWIKGTDQLFVLSSAGIYIVDRNELLSGKDEISYELLNSRRGLNGSLTANAWTWFNEESGDLYLPCDTGVFVINTASFSSGTQFYRMSVTGIRTDGELHRIERNGVTTIPRGVTRVEILPEVINYTIQDPYVGYRLEGLDGYSSEWTIVPQNSLNSIIYTNLPTGEFIFHLGVFDNSQQNILAERTYRLVKEKALFDNSWFIFYILFVPIFSVIWLIFMLMKRREDRIARELEQANRQIEMGKQTVVAIARTVDAKDKRTNEHSRRVALYSRQIAERYGLDVKQCQDIEWSAQMHDIGKIAIPDSILNKDSRLTDEEYATMKMHTVKGAEILQDFTLLDNVIDGAKYHHERYDGRGYPSGLKGEQIPLYARIIGVADAFDAMTANRVYRKQMDFGYVLGELERGKGTQFDPQFVDILLGLIQDGTIDLNQIYHVPTNEEVQNQDETQHTEQKEKTEKKQVNEFSDQTESGQGGNV